MTQSSFEREILFTATLHTRNQSDHNVGLCFCIHMKRSDMGQEGIPDTKQRNFSSYGASP